MTDTLTSLRPNVPFLDLGILHAPLKEALLAEFSVLIDSGAFVNGRPVAEFEAAFAHWCGTPFAVGVSSGLDALRVSLLAAGLEPGDEVIVPANTFVATVEAVEQAGGRAVLVDVGLGDYNVDVDAVAAAITPRTRVLLPVHLYGQLADMRAVVRLAERHSLAIVEDACQAHGAERDGLRAGAAGVAGAFSFYPGKNLGAFGDAGAITTANASLVRTARALREHGQHAKYRHDLKGYTARLDTIQAMVLLCKLPLLDGWNADRSRAAAYYETALACVGDLRLPPVAAGSEPVWHLYPVRTASPSSLAEHLASRGISTGRHYPEPVHLAPAFGDLGLGRGAFPVAEALADELLSLPIYPGIEEAALATVVDAVTEYFDA